MGTIQILFLSVALTMATACAQDEKSPENAANGVANESKNLVANCKLSEPIDIRSDDPRKNPVDLIDVEFDHPVKTDALKPVGPFSIQIFEIKYGERGIFNPTGYVGISLRSIDSNGKLESYSAGFANMYSGEFNVTGTLNKENGTAYYHTRDFYLIGSGTQKSILTELEMIIEGHKLVSLKLTFPVEVLIPTTGNLTYTGENLTVCLKKAVVK